MSYEQIPSAEEFRRLRKSEVFDEYHRSAWASAADDVWLEVIERWPDMREWLAHNRTISPEIVERLAVDPDWRVRHRIATKRKLPDHVRAALRVDADEVVAKAAHRFGSS